MLSQDDIKSRYTEIKRVADDFGRQIGVRRLKITQQAKLLEMTESRDPALMSIFIAGAAVCEIDGKMITFPRNRGELDSILDILDDAGLRAVAPAYLSFAGDEVDVDPKS